jgi:hypothetical protein
LKSIIAIPTEPVRKAGAKVLVFKSQAEASRYFGIDRTYICRILRHTQKSQPYCGFFFDYVMEE